MSFAGKPPDLWNPRIVAKDADQRPVLGAMARYVGSQYSIEEVWQHYRNRHDVYPQEEDALRPLAARIRAFDVPVMRGVTFVVTRLQDVALAVLVVLTERLPDIPWDPFNALRISRIKKYGLIHETIEAPLDEASQEPMVLEIYGRIDQFNGQPVNLNWYRKIPPGDVPGDDDKVIGEMTFRLEQATYANTRWPGIGVPFYM